MKNCGRMFSSNQHTRMGIDSDGYGPVESGDPKWVEDICACCLQDWPCSMTYSEGDE